MTDFPINSKVVLSFYEYFNKRRYLEKKKFIPTKTNIKDVNTFLEIIDSEYSLHSVGLNFLYEYFIFQYQYWDNVSIESKFNDKIALNYIIGKKAFERWKTRDKEFDWTIEKNKIEEKYGIVKSYLIEEKEIEEQQPKFSLEKEVRKKYLNTDKGLAMCIEYTTLYDPKDLSCLRCKYQKDCKELLRVNYPKLYKERGLK